LHSTTNGQSCGSVILLVDVMLLNILGRQHSCSINDENGKEYEILYDTLQKMGLNTPWYFLDGLKRDQLMQRAWSRKFAMLATSEQFEIKNESDQKPCLLLYCKLEDLALLLENPKESDINCRYIWWKSS
jgi:hypothetical protein